MSCVRLGDSSSGHGAFPPTVAIEGSPDVFVNGKPCVRLGDAWNIHCDPDSCHQVTSTQGCPTVLVNGKPKVVIGSSLSCGDTAAQGSPNVIVGKGSTNLYKEPIIIQNEVTNG